MACSNLGGLPAGVNWSPVLGAAKSPLFLKQNNGPQNDAFDEP